MPFCSQCGNQVTAADQFCGRCGAAQPGATAPPPPPPRGAPYPQPGSGRDPLDSIDSRTASILCYIPGLGWIMAIIVLAADRFRNDRAVRFHGFQALYLFVAWLIEQQVIAPLLRDSQLYPVHNILQLVLLGASILMMVKAAHQEQYSLPLVGDLARKSMSEH
ncbi:MAG: hypothetical protein JST11_02120 [Acidobacteria bacterium]|nr:hypothetical protein [Acidobacteriota bacterium]